MSEIKQVGGTHYSRFKIDAYEFAMENQLNPLTNERG